MDCELLPYQNQATYFDFLESLAEAEAISTFERELLDLYTSNTARPPNLTPPTGVYRGRLVGTSIYRRILGFAMLDANGQYDPITRNVLMSTCSLFNSIIKQTPFFWTIFEYDARSSLSGTHWHLQVAHDHLLRARDVGLDFLLLDVRHQFDGHEPFLHRSLCFLPQVRAMSLVLEGAIQVRDLLLSHHLGGTPAVLKPSRLSVVIGMNRIVGTEFDLHLSPDSPIVDMWLPDYTPKYVSITTCHQYNVRLDGLNMENLGWLEYGSMRPIEALLKDDGIGGLHQQPQPTLLSAPALLKVVLEGTAAGYHLGKLHAPNAHSLTLRSFDLTHPAAASGFVSGLRRMSNSLRTAIIELAPPSRSTGPRTRRELQERLIAIRRVLHTLAVLPQLTTLDLTIREEEDISLWTGGPGFLDDLILSRKVYEPWMFRSLRGVSLNGGIYWDSEAKKDDDDKYQWDEAARVVVGSSEEDGEGSASSTAVSSPLSRGTWSG